MFIKYMFKTEITGRRFKMTKSAFLDNELHNQRPVSRGRERRLGEPK